MSISVIIIRLYQNFTKVLYFVFWRTWFAYQTVSLPSGSTSDVSTVRKHKRRSQSSFFSWRRASRPIKLTPCYNHRCKVTLQNSFKLRLRGWSRKLDRKVHNWKDWQDFYLPYNIEGKITDCWLLRQRAFFLNFLSNEGKITDSWLAKRQKYSHLIGWARERDICIL